jgi:putative transposase
MKRVPASMRTREDWTSLIEGRLSTASAKDALVKLATRLVVEEALEAEVGDTIGREYYKHGAGPGQGHRNGYRPGRPKTAEGFVDYSAPQVAGREEPFHSALREHLKGHTQALEGLAIEMLARGLSVRDIEDAFKDESGRLLLSRTAVSELGARLWEDYQAFAQRDLSEYQIAYLFVDGVPSGCEPGLNASRCWRPGATRRRASASCCI